MNFRNVVILMLAVLIIGLVIFLFFDDKDNKQPVLDTQIAAPISTQDQALFVSKNYGLNEEEVVRIVKKYIEENPEAIMKSIENYYAAKANEAKTIQKNMLMQSKDKIYNNINDPRIGNPKGSIKIVEFFDYACSFCRKMLPIQQKILAEYPNIQLVLKELPIMGDWSVQASKAALAVTIVDNSKYEDFHNKLLNLEDRTEASIMQTAADIGLDVTKLKDMMQKLEIEDIIQANLKLAADLKIRGTPAYIINDDILPGALSYAEIKSALESAGAKKIGTNTSPSTTSLTAPSSSIDENPTSPSVSTAPEVPVPSVPALTDEHTSPQQPTASGSKNADTHAGSTSTTPAIPE
ncbi:MAG: DsbA family protein [Candidatus Midichloria sp.]|uniref:Outer membrane protein n=1 Tax=Hyalomma marginatum TaxID=34627 RepID=A0A8S4BWR6_9ACAR|nr:outer membrane protein [Hyalomma marginatum]CAG7592347.1 outer membrane protein [Hyalomma marginatum]